MMKRPSAQLNLLAGAAVAIVGLCAASGNAVAQDFANRRHAVRHAASADAPVSYRGLTITRPPDAAPDAYDSDDPYDDGPIRYNDIRDFSPFPYADSGRQFPFGFDGVGGYGSDLGFNEGHDAAVYDRGAFNREAK